jgi:uncharacterized membrane protein
MTEEAERDKCRIVAPVKKRERGIDLNAGSNMLPSPLHPAVVHFPIVLVFLLPVAAFAALWAIRRGSRPLRAWLVPTGVAAALALSSWVAVETGEQQEERAEAAVSESLIHSHEEAAERFLMLSAAVLGVTALGLFQGRAGRALRITGATAALALVAAGYQVGHTGGKVVYGDGVRGGLVSSTAVARGQDGGDDARRDRGEPEEDED